MKKSFRFSGSKTDFYFDEGLPALKAAVKGRRVVMVTDEHVFAAHPGKFQKQNTIVLRAGEQYKVQQSADVIIEQLLDMGADRQTVLVGVGGGVVTDLTGYVASIYMRGISFGFVPTSLLAMVDATIGGKNGIDVGPFKNMVGTIRQPEFIIYEPAFLRTLPEKEWRNGFAEIIKHAAILDAPMFAKLEKQGSAFYRKNKNELAALIRRNALLKTRLVQEDEFEHGNRRLLNFGHTIGHAVENLYALAHGEAISVGMTYAAGLSEAITGFGETERLTALLEAYQLPTYVRFQKNKVLPLIQKDKKKMDGGIRFILLEKIGKARIQSLTPEQIGGILP